MNSAGSRMQHLWLPQIHWNDRVVVSSVLQLDVTQSMGARKGTRNVLADSARRVARKPLENAWQMVLIIYHVMFGDEHGCTLGTNTPLFAAF